MRSDAAATFALKTLNSPELGRSAGAEIYGAAAFPLSTRAAVRGGVEAAPAISARAKEVPVRLPLHSGLLRGSKLTPRAGARIERGHQSPRPRHELCCRCATACASLLRRVFVVSFAPSSNTGSEGNFCAERGTITGERNPVAALSCCCGDAPPSRSFPSSL
jgi:hypothetical protein